MSVWRFIVSERKGDRKSGKQFRRWRLARGLKRSSGCREIDNLYFRSKNTNKRQIKRIITKKKYSRSTFYYAVQRRAKRGPSVSRIEYPCEFVAWTNLKRKGAAHRNFFESWACEVKRVFVTAFAWRKPGKSCAMGRELEAELLLLQNCRFRRWFFLLLFPSPIFCGPLLSSHHGMESLNHDITRKRRLLLDWILY